MPDNRNVLRNTADYPMDGYYGEQHYTIGPFDRLVLPDIGDEDMMTSLMSTACAGSTVGSYLYPEDELNPHGNLDRSFTAGDVQYGNQDTSQRKGF